MQRIQNNFKRTVFQLSFDGQANRFQEVLYKLAKQCTFFNFSSDNTLQLKHSVPAIQIVQTFFKSSFYVDYDILVVSFMHSNGETAIQRFSRYSKRDTFLKCSHQRWANIVGCTFFNVGCCWPTVLAVFALVVAILIRDGTNTDYPPKVKIDRQRTPRLRRLWKRYPNTTLQANVYLRFRLFQTFTSPSLFQRNTSKKNGQS